MKEVKEYHDNGQLRRHYWRNEKGQTDGEYKSWHSNEQPWVHCFHKNGLPNGEYKRWHPNGQLIAHYFYHNDKEIAITNYVQDINNITEQEYFLLQITFGYFPLIKFVGTIQ